MANNQYVNKVVYGNNTVMDISNTTANAGDVLEGQTFYAANGAQTTGTLSLNEYARTSVLNDSVGWITLHNFFDDESYDDTTKTVNGITFTDNGDGSVTVSGTATGDASFMLFERNFYFDSYENSPATFFLSGCPVGGDFDSYDLWLENITSGDDAIDFGEYDFDRPCVRINRGDYVRSGIYISSGTVISNPITFRPELKISYSYEGSTEDAYYPQHPSVNQTLRDAEVIEGKNLLNVTANSQIVKGITYTVNDDKSVTLNGTSTDDWASITLTDEFILPAGKYYFSGISGGGSSTYRMMINRLSPADEDIVLYNRVATVVLSVDTTIRVQASVRTSGTTVNNVTLYPMICRSTEDEPLLYEPYYVPLKDRESGGGSNKVVLIEGTAQDSPIGVTGIGTWQDVLNNPTKADEQSWGWVEIPELNGIGDSDNIRVVLSYDPAKSDVISLGGYIIDDETNMMCIKFGNTISVSDTHTAVIGVEIIENEVST